MTVWPRIRGKKCSPRGRRGSLLAEVAMSCAMLMIAMALTIKVLGWVALNAKPGTAASGPRRRQPT